MDEFGPDEQEWIDVLRAADEPRDVDRARVRASLLASIGAASAASAAVGGEAISAGSAKAAAIANASGVAKTTGGVAKTAGLFAAPWKIGVAVVSVAIAGGGVGVLLHRAPANVSTAVAVRASSVTQATASPPPAAPPLSVPPAVVEDATPQAPVVEAPPSASSMPRTSRSGPPSRAASQGHAITEPPPPRSSVTDNVDAELVLLARAQHALKRGDASGALEALARHSREHPRGALAVEREGLRAVASCESKRTDGRALAERFIAANPQSPLVARVRGSCLSTEP